MKNYKILSRERSLLFFPLSLMLSLVFSFPTLAENQKADLTQMNLGDLMTLEVRTVQGASKFEQKTTEAPASVSIVTADQIKKYGYRTLADILRAERSFHITYDRNYTYWGSRGFGRPADYNTRFLLLVDNHRVNDNIYDSAFIGTEFVLDVDLIERVEVIRGPGSSLYGSSAFFGVINAKNYTIQPAGGNSAGISLHKSYIITGFSPYASAGVRAGCMMTSLFSPPSPDDLIRLLKAWKFWVVGALVGALIGAAVYYIFPPAYQARATVSVDFNLEEAWPQETDRQQFYYLERETRKLEDIAWSDEVLQVVSSGLLVPVEELRAGKLELSQPAEAGWHFYATDRSPERAQQLAAAWAMLFEGIL